MYARNFCSNFLQHFKLVFKVAEHMYMGSKVHFRVL
jgi:hypothetical protein